MHGRATTTAQTPAALSATTAAETIATLQANGYRVIVNKVGIPLMRHHML
ncbi:hypothetical protein C8E89_10713 [Mycolicibacterium moriokaense]|uniref:Uncharacterized protein n=1 Tax=Mycolicibacterium moriokaense TaxID=39691 RepID=A0A318HH03_9MYCO|nr:hypothetical protein C8E89_10713 [Mycolicibacterium moriokaense]